MDMSFKQPEPNRHDVRSLGYLYERVPEQQTHSFEETVCKRENFDFNSTPERKEEFSEFDNGEKGFRGKRESITKISEEVLRNGKKFRDTSRIALRKGLRKFI